MKNNKELLQKLLEKIKETPDNVVEDSIDSLNKKLVNKERE